MKNIIAAGVPSKEYLDNLPKYVDTLARQTWANLDAGQNQLTEKIHSLAALGVIAAKSKSTELAANVDIFVTQLYTFLTTVEPPVLRHCPSLRKYFLELSLSAVALAEASESSNEYLFNGMGYLFAVVDTCQNLTDALVRRRTALKGINVVATAIRQYQAHDRQLTSIHANLLELCLAANIPKAAMPFLSDDIDDFSAEVKTIVFTIRF